MSVQVQAATSGGRTAVSTGNAWETRYGYSRLVRVGDTLRSSGTLGVESDGSYGTAADQARRALEILDAALSAAGAGLGDVVAVRGYLTDVADVDDVGEVFREVFARHVIRPCFMQVAVAALAHPAARVELELEAIASRPMRPDTEGGPSGVT